MSLGISEGYAFYMEMKKNNVPPSYYDDALKIPIYKRYHSNRFRSVCRLIGNVEGLLLDIGCNGGTFIDYLSKYCKPVFVVGLDIDKEVIRYAKKIRAQINFIVAHGCYLPFRDQTFKVITLLEVLEHVEKPELMLREAGRVLSKDGFIVCMVPNEDSRLFKIVWFIWTKVRGRVWRNTHLVKFSDKILIEKLKDEKFEVINFAKINFGMLMVIKAVKRR
ncbi:MAG: class I SAM-dependent methyltransferase [Aigarchaeota archaeon]|nr:class I SAM-dependent methyltransferase [Candidatus Geocrenenecus dongiae]